MEKEEFETMVKELFDGHWYYWRDPGFWQIESSPYLTDHGFHYELLDNRVVFHIESSNWRPIRNMFYEKWKDIEGNGVCSEKWWNRNDCCYFMKESGNSEKEQLRKLKNVLQPIIDEYVEKNGLRPAKHVERANPNNELFDKVYSEDKEVILYNGVKLKELFDNNLLIPDYQRIYCWRKKNVIELLRDVYTINDNDNYHLGSVILHKNEKDKGFDIVDGQQRLVTLTLLMEALGYDGCLPLIRQRFLSDEARRYIAYSKHLCEEFASHNKKENLCELILDKLSFTVLIINSNHFELAYTFFSNENSRGKALNDFNLLKAHHLRYIAEEEQQKHLASRWDELTRQTDTGVTVIDYSLGQHILRLRKWMQREIVPQEKYVVRDEYVAAPVLDDVPGFGEQFHFNESIQGGQHFFVYAERMTARYRDYANTDEHKALIQCLSGESHYRYSQLIDSLLFGYYLKFDRQYLAEALYVIEQTISHHRYTNARAIKNKIMEYATNSRIIMMIDRATSPTFFFAQLLQEECAKDGLDGIRKRYHDCTVRMYKQLQSNFTIESLTERINKV